MVEQAKSCCAEESTFSRCAKLFHPARGAQELFLNPDPEIVMFLNQDSGIVLNLNSEIGLFLKAREMNNMIGIVLDLVQPYAVASLRRHRAEQRRRAKQLGLEGYRWQTRPGMFRREIRWWREMIVSIFIVIVCGGIVGSIAYGIATSG